MQLAPIKPMKKVAGKAMKNRGFTLIELLVTVVVVAILATVAVPNFQRTIAGNRIVSDYNEILAGLTLARSEAIKRRTKVTFELTQTGAGERWRYEVRVGEGGGTGELIRERRARDSRVSLAATLSGNSLTFGVLGTPANGSSCPNNCRITLSSSHDGIEDRLLEVSRQGRVGKGGSD